MSSKLVSELQQWLEKLGFNKLCNQAGIYWNWYNVTATVIHTSDNNDTPISWSTNNNEWVEQQEQIQWLEVEVGNQKEANNRQKIVIEQFNTKVQHSTNQSQQAQGKTSRTNDENDKMNTKIDMLEKEITNLKGDITDNNKIIKLQDRDVQISNQHIRTIKNQLEDQYQENKKLHEKIDYKVNIKEKVLTKVNKNPSQEQDGGKVNKGSLQNKIDQMKENTLKRRSSIIGISKHYRRKLKS